MIRWLAVGLLTLLACNVSRGQEAGLPTVLFRNVRVFDGKSSQLSERRDVLVRGNLIAAISEVPLPAPSSATIVLDGDGRVLMPGLIDAHTHIMFESVPQLVVLTTDAGFVHVAAARSAERMLQRGFTSIRDLGGPVFGLRKAIDLGITPGPRIWPSGAFVSQSGGHGDFRLPTDLPSRPGDFTHSERVGAAAIADSPDAVRMRVRELLALGASQIKLMAGGGIASSYDPLDVTQYSVAEIRAAVEAADNWGTYVTVHAYTPKAVRQAIEAGVRCIEHGQLLDEETVRLMKERNIWWSLQPFTDDRPSAYAEGSLNRLKQLEMYKGTDTAFRLARHLGIRTAWGTDTLFSAEVAAQQGQQLARMIRWYPAGEVLQMATRINAELLAESGPRNPYPGKLGVIEEGALADLLLIDGNPLEQIELLADPAAKILVIVKDGQVCKNALSPPPVRREGQGG